MGRHGKAFLYKVDIKKLQFLIILMLTIFAVVTSFFFF